jgi:hypothetical protein
MTLQFGLFALQGWRMDLVGRTDPIEVYETMTHVAQEAEALGYHSHWLFDHFHSTPNQRKNQPLNAGPVQQPWHVTLGAYILGRWSPATAIAILRCTIAGTEKAALSKVRSIERDVQSHQFLD